jgi:hypothetical protein
MSNEETVSIFPAVQVVEVQVQGGREDVGICEQ